MQPRTGGDAFWVSVQPHAPRLPRRRRGEYHGEAIHLVNGSRKIKDDAYGVCTYIKSLDLDLDLDLDLES